MGCNNRMSGGKIYSTYVKTLFWIGDRFLWRKLLLFLVVEGWRAVGRIVYHLI